MQMITKMFGLLSLDPQGKDTSSDLYKALLEYVPYESFTAVQGFGYAFQDELGVLQDNIDQSVVTVQGLLNELTGEKIDERLSSFILDQNCREDFSRSV